MRTSWILVILLLVLVALFSVQNAAMITVRFAVWEFSTSAALIILLAALAGALVGFVVGAFSRRTPRRPASSAPASPTGKPQS